MQIFTAYGTVKILNTGNVAFKMRFFHNSVTLPIDSFVVNPGGSVHLPPTTTPTTSDQFTVEFDGQGVVSNPYKLPPSGNGKVYAVIMPQ